MIFKYRKLFGIIRILLGILYLLFPGYEYFRQGGELSELSMTLLFVFLFFLLYSLSAIRNGILELNKVLPAFNLLRFFEAAMNGFIGLYILIISVYMKISSSTKIFFVLLALIIIMHMIRDLKLISIQYYDRRRKKL